MAPNPNLVSSLPGFEMTLYDGADKRAKRINSWMGIVIHHTGTGGRKFKAFNSAWWRQFTKNMVRWLGIKDNAYLSAHFVIGKEGEVTQVINPDKYEAFHAGRSAWTDPVTKQKYLDINKWCIGIELIGDGNVDNYTDEQYQKLVQLVVKLQIKYGLKKYALMAHSEINPNKVDPGKYFEWVSFRNAVLAAHSS